MINSNHSANEDDMFVDDADKDILTHLDSIDSCRSIHQSTINEDLICCLQHMESCQFFDSLSRASCPETCNEFTIDGNGYPQEENIQTTAQEQEW